MFTNADAHEAALPYFRAVLADKERRYGSRMTAYDRLANRLGRSPSWVRKIVRGEPDAVLELRDWLNLSAAYDRLCTKIEAAAAHEAARADALQGARDEAGGGIAHLATRAPSPDRRGAAGRPAPLPLPTHRRLVGPALEPDPTVAGR